MREGKVFEGHAQEKLWSTRSLSLSEKKEVWENLMLEGSVDFHFDGFPEMLESRIEEMVWKEKKC